MCEPPLLINNNSQSNDIKFVVKSNSQDDQFVRGESTNKKLCARKSCEWICFIFFVSIISRSAQHYFIFFLIVFLSRHYGWWSNPCVLFSVHVVFFAGLFCTNQSYIECVWVLAHCLRIKFIRKKNHICASKRTQWILVRKSQKSPLIPMDSGLRSKFLSSYYVLSTLNGLVVKAVGVRLVFWSSVRCRLSASPVVARIKSSNYYVRDNGTTHRMKFISLAKKLVRYRKVEQRVRRSSRNWIRYEPNWAIANVFTVIRSSIYIVYMYIAKKILHNKNARCDTRAVFRVERLVRVPVCVRVCFRRRVYIRIDWSKEDSRVTKLRCKTMKTILHGMAWIKFECTRPYKNQSATNDDPKIRARRRSATIYYGNCHHHYRWPQRNEIRVLFCRYHQLCG